VDFPDLVLLVLFALMAAAIALDRRLAGLEAAGRGGLPRAAEAQGRRAATGIRGPGRPRAARGAPALPVPRSAFVQLGEVAGWALLGPTGRLLAANLPRDKALLAALCALMRLRELETGTAPAPRVGGAEGPAIREAPWPARWPGAAGPGGWRTASAPAPAGVLLGLASPSGAVLAAVAPAGTDAETVARRMTWCLAEVEAGWAVPARYAPRG
jgi:hypothetical protein